MEPWAQPRPNPSPITLVRSLSTSGPRWAADCLELHGVSEHLPLEHEVVDELGLFVSARHDCGISLPLGFGLRNQALHLRPHLARRHGVFHQAIAPAHEVGFELGFVGTRSRQIVEVAAVGDAPGLHALLGEPRKLRQQTAGRRGAGGRAIVRIGDAKLHRLLPRSVPRWPLHRRRAQSRPPFARASSARNCAFSARSRATTVSASATLGKPPEVEEVTSSCMSIASAAVPSNPLASICRSHLPTSASESP